MTSSEHSPPLEPDDDQVSALLPGPGLSFRGGAADWWRDGETYVEPGWLRSSRDPRTATDNFAGGDVVALFGASGRDLATLGERPEEQETVFLPGSRFTVLRRADVEGLRLTVVRVLPDGDNSDGASDTEEEIADAVTRAASAVARSLTLPAETVARPERFSGEFGTRR